MYIYKMHLFIIPHIVCVSFSTVEPSIMWVLGQFQLIAVIMQDLFKTFVNVKSWKWSVANR